MEIILAATGSSALKGLAIGLASVNKDIGLADYISFSAGHSYHSGKCKPVT